MQTKSASQLSWYINKPQVWDAKKCRRMARHTAKDGMGTKHWRKGYIGSFQHFGYIRYNGGCVRNDQWYDGECFPLPLIAPGFQIVRIATWGYYIEETPKS